MNDCSVVLDAARPLPASSTAANRFRGLVGVAVLGLVLMLVLNVLRREPYYGDEGFYAMTAVNMVKAPGEYLLRPSYYPAGDFTVEKDAFAHPPVSSYLYALTLWIFGGALAGLDVLNVLAFALLLFFVWKTLKLFDEAAAAFAIVLLAVSPSLFHLFSQIETEPLMVTFGVASLYCALRAQPSSRPGRWLFASGLCFGMAFVLKLWLAAPIALALLAAVVLSGFKVQGSPVKGLAILVGAALIPSAAHLLAVALFSPGDLGFWLNNIYFGVFTSSGISGGKLAAEAVPSDWAHPWWYYGATFYRDHFFLLPIILLGGICWFLERRMDWRLLAIIAAGAIGIAPLSLMTVKEPLYILPCTVFIYLLAGCCLAALARRLSSGGDFPPMVRLFCAGALAMMLAGIALAYAKGIKRSDITTAFVIGHSVVMAVSLALCLFAFRRTSFPLQSAVCVACALFLVGAFGHRWVVRPPLDKAVVELVRPHIAGHGARELSFVASNYKPYQAMTFRRGCYWEELPKDAAPEAVLQMPQFAAIRAFVIDAKDQRKGHFKYWTDWLEKNAVEQTRELDGQLGRPSGLRVFVVAKPG